MPKLLKNLLFFWLNLFFINKQSGPTILMYHSIGHNQAFFTVKPEMFEKQLAHLNNRGFKVVFLSELLNRIVQRQLNDRLVCLTFDDGYLDNYEIVLPLLKKYQLPATFFLINNYLGKQWTNSQQITFPVLGVKEAIEMLASGLVEFMPHTVNHLRLDNLPIAQAAEEIKNSRGGLEELTGNQANILAYPNGKFSRAIIELLSQANWAGAVTTVEGLVKTDKINFFQLPRNAVDSKTSWVQFKGKLCDSINYYQQLKSLFKPR